MNRSIGEYEANVLADHQLLDLDEVIDLAREGYTLEQMAQMLDVNVELQRDEF
ncbi:hypothetical protein [Paenibacillus sanfengchensis]|uniref:hypothetical protein n=1 Tax=Paenibacillus sanfengchensis TaxID=3119819 RepID=UPI002FE250CB